MEPMKVVFAAKFWNEEVESTRSLDASVYSVPHEPPALGLIRGSKLFRSQQLLLAQNLFRVPFMPAVEPASAANNNYGGIVLDRVIASAGGVNWWTTITGRARAQQFWFIEKQRRERRQANLQQGSEVEEEKWWHRGQRMLNSSLYALTMQSHVDLGHHTSLTASSEVDSVTSLLNLPSESERRGLPTPWRSRVSLKHKMKDHDWIFESAYSGHFVDREARYWEVPQVITLDFASVGSRIGGLRYRVGLHQSSGDPVQCPRDDGPVLGVVPVGARPGVRAQGGFSFEKDVHLWKKTEPRDKRKKPYRLLASHPHVTLSGITGALMCAQKHLGSELPPRDSEQTESNGPPPSVRSRGFLGRVWGPVFGDLFTSIGITAQFGVFERLFLDHTKVGTRLDIGAASSLNAITRRSDSNTSGSGTSNMWADSGLPTMSLSFEQQVVGPICARVDSRFTMDPKNITAWPPNLQDITYGVDWSLERLGATKLLVWYSPTRQEGMAELRIFER